MWLKCILFTFGAVASTVALVCTYYECRKNQRAITQGRTYNSQIKKESRCSICLKELKPSEEIVLPCKHTFCSTCLKALFNGTQKTCCVCRKEISSCDLHVLKISLNKLD